MDILDLKNRMRSNPEDKELLEVIKKEALRRGDGDLETFSMIFEPLRFLEIEDRLFGLGSGILDYFSPEEWEIIYRNNPVIKVWDKISLL